MKLFTTVIALATLCVGLSNAASSVVCGGSSSSKNILLSNPSITPRLCEYTIQAYSSNVCQLRIEFAMTLAQPSLPDGRNGLKVPECVNDYVQIGDLKLCGVETAQHIYVPFNRTAGVKSVDVKFYTAARAGGAYLPSPSWKFEVIQLECPTGSSLRSIEYNDEPVMRASAKDGFLLAPPGCDQYFPDATGTIESFNYYGGRGIFPYNLNYAICFRRTTSTTGLLIKGTDFNMGREETNVNFFAQTDNFCYPQVQSEGRTENYLMIPQAVVLENDVHASYFCGHSVEGYTVLSTNPGPLLVVFNSDGVYQQGVTAEGFSLKYEVLSD